MTVVHKRLSGMVLAAALAAVGAARAANVEIWTDQGSPAFAGAPVSAPAGPAGDPFADGAPSGTAGSRLLGDTVLQFADGSRPIDAEDLLSANQDALQPTTAAAAEVRDKRPDLSPEGLAQTWGPWVMMAAGLAAIGFVLSQSKKRYGVTLLDAFRREPTL